MKRPGWAVVIGIFMILIGGCGALNNFQDMNAEKILEQQKEQIAELEFSHESSTSDKTEQKEVKDSTDEKFIGFFGDSIVKDSNNNVDVKETIGKIVLISPYRIKWMKNFAYIGVIISILFIVSGVFFLVKKEYTIKLSISVLAISLVLGILQFIVFSADTDSGKAISFFSNIGIYFGIFVDVLLLICIMVLDKSYYNQTPVAEDYYD